MSGKTLENLDKVLDQLIQNASALNEEETDELLKEQDLLLEKLVEVSNREMKREELQDSPEEYNILDQKIRCYSTLNRSRLFNRRSVKS